MSHRGGWGMVHRSCAAAPAVAYRWATGRAPQEFGANTPHIPPDPFCVIQLTAAHTQPASPRSTFHTYLPHTHMCKQQTITHTHIHTHVQAGNNHTHSLTHLQHHHNMCNSWSCGAVAPAGLCKHAVAWWRARWKDRARLFTQHSATERAETQGSGVRGGGSVRACVRVNTCNSSTTAHTLSTMSVSMDAFKNAADLIPFQRGKCMQESKMTPTKTTTKRCLPALRTLS